MVSSISVFHNTECLNMMNSMNSLRDIINKTAKIFNILKTKQNRNAL